MGMNIEDARKKLLGTFDKVEMHINEVPGDKDTRDKVMAHINVYREWLNMDNVPDSVISFMAGMLTIGALANEQNLLEEMQKQLGRLVHIETLGGGELSGAN